MSGIAWYFIGLAVGFAIGMFIAARIASDSATNDYEEGYEDGFKKAKYDLMDSMDALCDHCAYRGRADD